MTAEDPRIDAFFDEAGRWQAELRALRAILRDSPLRETFKWRAPCYTYRDANLATIWGFRHHCALSFFKGVLLQDAQDILTAPGENSRSVRMATFTSVAGIDAAAGLLKQYIAEAVALENSGRKVEFRKDDLAYPDELVERLEDDPEFRQAFEALTPGRRRGYILHFLQAKLSRTRTARIEKHAPRIRDGKGLHDR